MNDQLNLIKHKASEIIGMAQAAEETVEDGHNAEHFFDAIEFDCKAILGSIKTYYKKHGRVIDEL